MHHIQIAAQRVYWLPSSSATIIGGIGKRVTLADSF